MKVFDEGSLYASTFSVISLYDFVYYYKVYLM